MLRVFQEENFFSVLQGFCMPGCGLGRNVYARGIVLGINHMENVHKTEEMHMDAAGAQLERGRREICQRLAECQNEEVLWQAIILFQHYPFRTSGRGARPGVEFTYRIKERRDGKLGGEIVVDRKEKTITQSSVCIAYQKVKELGGVVSGPKKLGVFGASYLYSIFIRLGVICRTAVQKTESEPKAEKTTGETEADPEGTVQSDLQTFRQDIGLHTVYKFEEQEENNNGK